jgi:hypothetical protein
MRARLTSSLHVETSSLECWQYGKAPRQQSIDSQMQFPDWCSKYKGQLPNCHRQLYPACFLKLSGVSTCKIVQCGEKWDSLRLLEVSTCVRRKNRVRCVL